MNTTINALFLKSLLLAEITRFKFGKDGMSLTSPSLERNARQRFAASAGIKPNSKPAVFIKTIGIVYEVNGQKSSFDQTLTRFNLSPLDFATTTHFQIIYKNGNNILNVENRTHETTAVPSERMIVNALHSLCLNNGITNFEHAKAELYKNGGYQYAYRLNGNN